MKLNRYQFDRIVSQTKQMVTPIRRGEEDGVYFEYLALIEMSLYQAHQTYGIDGRQAKEILQMILFDIKGLVGQEDYDYGQFEDTPYRVCADKIEELFFPEKNAELKRQLKEGTLMDDQYFELARKVLVRIHESVSQWTDDFGAEGYFNFIGSFIEAEIKTNRKYLVEPSYLRKG